MRPAVDLRAGVGNIVLRAVRGDYSQVTEVPGVRLTRENIAMVQTRYAFAAAEARGDVLEVACGVGQGLGLLRARARRLVAGDYTESLLRFAHDHYGSRVPLIRLDAHELPFRERSFDVVILYEALYYLREPQRFVGECRRVLRPGGRLLVCTVNRLWSGFNPSPHSTRYLTAGELGVVLGSHGFAVELFGAHRDAGSSRLGTVAAIRALAVRLHLMPRTMRGKELLKRLFYGPLQDAPAELGPAVPEAEGPEPLADAADRTYKVIFARGTLRS